MRLLIWLILSVSLGGCAFIPIKTPPPDGPICTGLATIPERRYLKKFEGEAVLQRPNPVCMNGLKDDKGKLVIKGIGEPYCGYCVWTMSDKAQLVGNKWPNFLELKGKRKTWDTVIDEGGVIPAETQADSKAFAINVCKATNGCGDNITRWRVKLDSLDSVGRATKKSKAAQP